MLVFSIKIRFSEKHLEILNIIFTFAMLLAIAGHAQNSYGTKHARSTGILFKVEMKYNPQDLDERVVRAVENFMAGYGCCQSVVAAFSDLYGLDETMAKRIAAGFGGGVGRMRMMCGAVSGIVMLVGLECGQTEGSDREGKSACYKVVQELLAQSQAENGSLICAEILGLNGHEKAQCSYVASPRTAEYYKTRPCVAKVESAARIIAEYLKRIE